VKTAFFKIGQTKLELLEPTCPESTIAGFIEKRGEGIHHLAFATDDVAACLAEAEEKGVRLIDKAPRPGAEQMMIAFVHPKSTKGVLTEFCMKKKEE
jgi:methylmalonyl-CoA/ethylmalonyl-CoA epimerase